MQVRVCAELMGRDATAWHPCISPLSPCHHVTLSPRELHSRPVSPCPHAPSIYPTQLGRIYTAWTTPIFRWAKAASQ